MLFQQNLLSVYSKTFPFFLSEVLQQMKFQKLSSFFVIGFIIAGFSLTAFSQENPNLLKRTTYKTDKVEFGVGGTITILGAPNGSIEIEGWQVNEIEISAEIEVQAETQEDLEKISEVTGFLLDVGTIHTRIISVGTHDKKYLKKVDKKFPKRLRNMPFRIDYKIKVPLYIDLDITGGKGDLKLSKVEGMMKINFLETDAKLDLLGGMLLATFGKGNVDVTIPTRSWRGRKVDVNLVQGEMNVRLSPNLNAEVDAKVLRTGQIENEFTNLKKRDRTEFTEKLILAKAGSGGVPLSFTVGDGNLKLLKIK